MNYILTNGCFDLFHIGHATYLDTLRALAIQLDAKLVVFVNDDDSVANLKGVGRPVIPYPARAAMVGYWTDTVVPVPEMDCVTAMDRFVQSQMPGTVIYCKEAGGENGPEGVWARRNLFPIMTFSRMEGMSTTEIIERIQIRAAQQSGVPGQGRDAYPGDREAAARERGVLVAGGAAGTAGTAGYGLRSGDSYQSSNYRQGRVHGTGAARADAKSQGTSMERRRRDD